MLSIIFLGGIAVLFYFVLIKPRRRQQQQAADMLANLEIGDEVITTTGIYGQITGFDEGTVMLSVGINDDTVIKVSRQAIGQSFTYKDDWDEEEEEEDDRGSSNSSRDVSEDHKALGEGSEDPDGADDTA